jgi:uncharacterized protein
MKSRLRNLAPFLRLLAVIPLLLAFAEVCVLGGERRIELADGLNGAWRTPEASWDGRTMLLLHGFADDMDGAGNLQKRLAEALSSAGIASFRINFCGEGDRFRTNLLSTFHGRVADTTNVLEWVRSQAGVDVRHIGVMGWSLGGATAAGAAAVVPDRIRCMVLWSSAGGDLHEGFTRGNFAATFEQAAREGQGRLEIPGWKTVTLQRGFFESFRGRVVEEDLRRYTGAFLSIRGTEDYLPAREAEFLKAVQGQPREAVSIGGADHVFNVFQPGSPIPDRVLTLTVDWLKRVL